MGKRKRLGDGVTRKADLKLNHVAELWSTALGQQCSLGERSLLECELLFSDIPEIDTVRLSYEVKSKLFATLFDLVYRFDVPGRAAEGDRVALQKNAEGFSAVGDCSDAARLLSSDLVLDRVQQLGIADIQAVFSEEAGLWRVEIKSLVGSTTWNLLPPVLHLIEPSVEECIKGTELIRMIAVALKRAS